MMPLDALLHAGFSMTDALWNCRPSGRETKPAISALLQPLSKSYFLRIGGHFRWSFDPGKRVGRTFGIRRTHRVTPD